MPDDLIRIEAAYAWLVICDDRIPMKDPSFDGFVEEYEHNSTYRYRIASLVYAFKGNSRWKRLFKKVRKMREERRKLRVKDIVYGSS